MPGEVLPAVRTSVSVSIAEAAGVVRVTGEGAHAFLDRLCPGELFLRDGQMVHALMLDIQGVPTVDLYVCRDDDAFLLLGEERPGFVVADYLRAEAGANVAVESLGVSHQLVNLDGPYAWELMVELATPSVVGLPYLNFFHGDGWVCFRAGKTGEYGYTLLTPREKSAALVERLGELGRTFDLAPVSAAELDQCALENGFFNIRREGTFGLTPLELQLQWRTSRRKQGFVGAEALKARREEGVRSRLTWLTSDRELAIGASVAAPGGVIGKVLSVGRSPALEAFVALGLLALPFAYPGSDGFVAGEERVPVLTVTPPVLQNRSLFVSPQRDSYLTRTTRTFPPLVRSRETS